MLLHEVLQIISNRDLELNRPLQVVDLPLLVLDNFILLMEFAFHLLLELFVFLRPILKLLLVITGLYLFFGQLSDGELELFLQLIVELQLFAVFLICHADLLQLLIQLVLNLHHFLLGLLLLQLVEVDLF